MLRTSERSSLKSCEFRWDIEYNQLRKPIVAQPALRYGTLIHKALAAYYVPGVKRGMNPVKAFDAAYRAEQRIVQEKFGARDEDDQWVEARDLGRGMLINYLDEYGTDPDWEVLVTEQPFRIMVSHPDTNDPWFWYVGVMDGVWRHRWNKSVWIPDHKTSAGIGGTTSHPNMPKHLPLDDQPGAYWSWGVEWLVQEQMLKNNMSLSGMMFNYLRKALPDARPSKLVDGHRHYLNKDGTVSMKQPSPYFARFEVHRDEYDREQAKQRAILDYSRIERHRSGDIPITKSPGMFTCPSCWARDICELHETGADWESLMAETTREWDPYDEHNIYDGR